MSLSHQFIIALGSLDKFGIMSVNKVCGAVESERVSIETPKDLYSFLQDKIAKGTLSRIRLPSLDEIEKSMDVATDIIVKCKRMCISIVSRYDTNFPQMLLSTVDEVGKPSVPVLLYYKGDLSITERPALAVIGTREPDFYGFRAGHYYAEAFAGIGVNIVSGLALGCDTAGHRGALDAGGVTTAFLAHGLDSVYPQENTDLANEIVDKGGLLLSEYPIGTRVNRYNLVARDRLQASLANSTLVIQTGIKGGTMHAVRATLAAKKPLFVVDYSKSSFDKVNGNIFLKKDGAIGLNPSEFSNNRIKSEPEFMINMILGKTIPVKVIEKKVEIYKQGLLSFD